MLIALVIVAGISSGLSLGWLRWRSAYPNYSQRRYHRGALVGNIAVYSMCNMVILFILVFFPVIWSWHPHLAWR
jgi:hypothetical protein